MLCRLCLKESLCSINMFDSDGIKLEIADILDRHFWFKPRPDDQMSPAICTMCWSKVYNFHQFYVKIERAHSTLCASNVEKEFVREYVGNEFTHNVIIKEEYSVTACSMEEKQKEFAEPEFIEIGYNAKDFTETFCSVIGKRNETEDLCIQGDVDAKQFSRDICSGDKINNEQTSSFAELIPEVDEVCDKLNKDDNHSNSSKDGSLLFYNPEVPASKSKSSEPVKNRKRLAMIKKNLPISKKHSSIKTPHKEKNKLSTDQSLPICDAEELDLLTENSSNSIIGASVLNSQEPEKSASLLNFVAQEHSEKTTKLATKRKKLTVSEQKIAELRQKRGVKTTCSDEELVKKFIPMRCSECIFDCENFTLLRNHFQIDHPNTKPYVKCCNRKWLHWMAIVHHAYKHEDPDLLKCQDCQKDFNDLGTLSRHMLDHHAPEEEQTFSCDVCPKKFARKVRLDLHRSTHVPMNERTFICDKCPNSRFGCKTMLLIHNKKVHRNTSFVCHVCAKKIKTKAFFEKHVRLHFEESGPKVKCTVDGCDHWLKDEDCLRLHLRRFHSKNKDKIFTCEVCGGKYKSRASITNHMLRVHPKTTYPCKICNKTFKRTRNLNDHMAQHTGESNYKCLFCACTFNTHGNYYTHLKKSHPVEYENWLKNKK